tara:strand:+ start:169 stop:285 length:117 start_codon:yes stop_codon:yes gene_type:complete
MNVNMNRKEFIGKGLVVGAFLGPYVVVRMQFNLIKINH